LRAGANELLNFLRVKKDSAALIKELASLLTAASRDAGTDVNKIGSSEILSLLKAAAHDAGMDVIEIRRLAQARGAENGPILAKRLRQSVIPLFIEREKGRPDRIGSCVLVRLDSDLYAFTAGHVIKDAGNFRLWAVPGLNGTLTPLPCNTGFHTQYFDVGILPLRASALGGFAANVFLTGPDQIDEDNCPDDDGFATFYFVFGYPASRTQFKVSHTPPRINQQSFQLTTSPSSAEVYSKEALSRADFLLLEFDRKNTLVGGKVTTPPKLQGVSGGGVFNISRITVNGPLVGIAIEHRQFSKTIVNTRIKHFLTFARHLRLTCPPETFA
jgi:hypothetical protein